MDAHEFVTVYSVTDVNQAELIKAELQTECITCRLSGENQAGLSGILEIEIMVQAVDADAARRFIKRHEERKLKA